MAVLGPHEFPLVDRMEWAKVDASPGGDPNIGFTLSLFLVIFLSSFLLLTPEFRYRGLLIYMVMALLTGR